MSSAGVLTRSRIRHTACASASALSMALTSFVSRHPRTDRVRVSCSDRTHIERSASHARRGRVRPSARRYVPAGKAFGQFGHAPARQLVRIGNAADREPAIAIGHDADLIAATPRISALRALRAGWRTDFFHSGKAIAIDEVERNSVLAPVGLDKRLLVGHIKRIAPDQFVRYRKETAMRAPLFLISFALSSAACSGTADDAGRARRRDDGTRLPPRVRMRCSASRGLRERKRKPSVMFSNIPGRPRFGRTRAGRRSRGQPMLRA